MPLSGFQSRVLELLATNRTEESHLAGGAGIHLRPGTPRYTNDLDYFHDREEGVAEAYARDRKLLEAAGLKVIEQLNRPGIVRVVVGDGQDATKVEWVHDSAWRFMPVRRDRAAGFVLHPVDLAVNKVLALAGRDEARDILDALFVHRRHLSLGALCWAACGKDPGFSPGSLVEMLARKGRLHKEDFEPLQLTRPIDLSRVKQDWIEALEQARILVRRLPAEEAGCLYYDRARRQFVEPHAGSLDLVLHRGARGGVLPQLGDGPGMQENQEIRVIFEEGYDYPGENAESTPRP